jgi:dienelactone hydrolase
MKKIFILFLPFFIFSQENKVENLKINDLIEGSFFTTSKNKTLTILIAGSGPTDRNGNQRGLENNSLQMLATVLTNVSDVFSYDKRIFAQMKTGNIKEEDLKFTDFSNDLIDVINYFKKLYKYKKIVLAGHSEGSTIAMLAMNHADAFVSIAGAGKPIDEILKEQLSKQLPQLNEEVATILTELKNGKTTDVTNPYLQAIFRKSVQPYMISWIQTNPVELIKNIQKPILILNGNKDLQVTEENAKLLQDANPKSKIIILENMNHVLKKIINDSDNYLSYTSPTFPIHEGLVDAMKKFIQEL